MEDLYNISISLHRFFAICAFVLSIIHIYLTQFGQGAKYVKKIRFFLPTYYSFLAALFMTGITILPILKFQLTFQIIFMLIAFAIMIFLGVLGYKFLKIAWATKRFDTYKKQMRIIIGINLALILIASFV